MGGIEVRSSTIVCPRCGQGYSGRRGYFYASKAAMYKGVSYIPICKHCVDQMYEQYLAASNDPKLAVRQMCRKLDLFWDESTYTSCANASVSRTVMTTYITRLNNMAYAGKCYDDTLKSEEALWDLGRSKSVDSADDDESPEIVGDIVFRDDIDISDIPDDVIRFWGPGYSASMYKELQDRYDYWLTRFPQESTLDIGGEMLLKQICSLELDINRDRTAGRQVDKSLNALNALLGSAMLKPAQKKDENGDAATSNTPYGVLIKRFEEERPIPDVDPELDDVDGIIRYITIWFFGHLCKMLNIKNSYCKLYEDAIAARRIENPEYDDEDDDTMIADLFAEDTEGEDDGEDE